MKPLIAAYMLSCAERAEVQEQSLRSWEGSDWGALPEVYLNAAACEVRYERIAAGMLALLRRALAGAGDYFLICEDDVRVDARLRARLESWSRLHAGAVAMASLYNPGVTGRLVEGDALEVDPELAIGAQGRIFSRACAEHVVRRYRQTAWHQDVAVARLAAECGPVWYHVPSLVQHVGRESTWGGPFHEALDFEGGCAVSDGGCSAVT